MHKLFVHVACCCQVFFITANTWPVTERHRGTNTTAKSHHSKASTPASKVAVRQILLVNSSNPKKVSIKSVEVEGRTVAAKE